MRGKVGPERLLNVRQSFMSKRGWEIFSQSLETLNYFCFLPHSLSFVTFPSLSHSLFVSLFFTLSSISPSYPLWLCPLFYIFCLSKFLHSLSSVSLPLSFIIIFLSFSPFCLRLIYFLLSIFLIYSASLLSSDSSAHVKF